MLKFNDKKAFEPSQASKMHEDLKDFFSAITSKDTYRSRSFLQEEIFQFKNLVSQFFIGKINLAI